MLLPESSFVGCLFGNAVPRVLVELGVEVTTSVGGNAVPRVLVEVGVEVTTSVGGNVDAVVSAANALVSKTVGDVGATVNAPVVVAAVL